MLPVQNQHDLTDLTLTCVQDRQGLSLPTYTLLVQGAPPATLTLAAYGYMAELAKQALLRLAYEHEIFAELVVPTQLSPFNIDPIINSAIHTEALLTIEEGTFSLGWGAEVIARVAETPGKQNIKYKRLAVQGSAYPSFRTT